MLSTFQESPFTVQVIRKCVYPIYPNMITFIKEQPNITLLFYFSFSELLIENH